MSEDWRNDPATEKQKGKLSFFGCTWDEGITKGQASDAIEECVKNFPETQQAWLNRPATSEQLEELRSYGEEPNSDLTYCRTQCPHCDGLIEFPSHGLGQRVDCPHCQQPLSLGSPDKLIKRVSLPPKLPSQKQVFDPAVHRTWESFMDTAKKNPMMLATSISIMLFAAFTTANDNGIDYRTNPGASIIGSMMPGAIIGIIWFCYKHKQRKKI